MADMAKRIAAVCVIYVLTAFAWMFLAGSVEDRTGDARGRLEGKVASSWGSAQQQSAPRAWGKSETSAQRLPLESSKIDVSLDLEHRQKGLLWYSTYQVGFAGSYVFRNTSDVSQRVEFTFDLPAVNAVYDDLQYTIDGQQVATVNNKTSVSGVADVPPGKTATLAVGYRSRGLDNWRYYFGEEAAQVRDFTMNMRTNFADIDFPESTLSPTQKRKTGAGWELQWYYKNLISKFQIGMTMPEKAQPGPSVIT
jgi:hypothetical protein